MWSTLIRHFDHDFVDLFFEFIHILYFHTLIYVRPAFTTDFLAVRLTLVVLLDVLTTGERPSFPDLGGGVDRH